MEAVEQAAARALEGARADVAEGEVWRAGLAGAAGVWSAAVVRGGVVAGPSWVMAARVQVGEKMAAAGVWTEGWRLRRQGAEGSMRRQVEARTWAGAPGAQGVVR